MRSRHANRLLASTMLLIAACDQQSGQTPAGAKSAATTETTKTEEKPKPAAEATPAEPAMEAKPQAAETDADAKPDDAGKNPRVVLSTSKGDIVLELDQEKAPISVANFLKYVDDGYYDNTIFHRVMDNFMIQGGGFGRDKKQKEAGEGIKNEWQNGLKNARGTVAMARLGGRPDSATAQFFINVVDNASLDAPRDGAGYAVFGKVVEGMSVVDAIKVVPTGVDSLAALVPAGDGKTHQPRPYENVPTEMILIRSAKRAD